MDAIKFDHNALAIPEVIGITDARSREILNQIDQADKKTETHTTFMEEAVRLSDPKNEAEFFFIGYALGVTMKKKVDKKTAQ